MNQEIIEQLSEKYKNLGENPETYLAGLLQSAPMNYWDYVNLDTLLSLQKPKTNFQDESIFIMYHQVTELVLKMMLHEIKQITETNKPSEEMLVTKINRLNRYTTMLITSFDIMKEGMSYKDYNTFRVALAPASGFQSVQFRLIELSCTRLENLVSQQVKEEDASVETIFEHLYWKSAGLDRRTGKKTLTLRQFEEKYQAELIAVAKKMNGHTIEEKINAFQNPSNELLQVLKNFDRLYNIDWPLVHLNTAQHYLDSKGENKQATGGSEWKKYLHPAHQKRRFFPLLWSPEELENWGKPLIQ